LHSSFYSTCYTLAEEEEKIYWRLNYHANLEKSKFEIHLTKNCTDIEYSDCKDVDLKYEMPVRKYYENEGPVLISNIDNTLKVHEKTQTFDIGKPLVTASEVAIKDIVLHLERSDKNLIRLYPYDITKRNVAFGGKDGKLSLLDVKENLQNTLLAYDTITQNLKTLDGNCIEITDEKLEPRDCDNNNEKQNFNIHH